MGTNKTIGAPWPGTHIAIVMNEDATGTVYMDGFQQLAVRKNLRVLRAKQLIVQCRQPIPGHAGTFVVGRVITKIQVEQIKDWPAC